MALNHGDPDDEPMYIDHIPQTCDSSDRGFYATLICRVPQIFKAAFSCNRLQTYGFTSCLDHGWKDLFEMKYETTNLYHEYSEVTKEMFVLLKRQR